jgi:hypothetical protein
MDFDLAAHPIINWAFGGIGIGALGWLCKVVWSAISNQKSQPAQDPSSLRNVVSETTHNKNEQNVNLNIYNGIINEDLRKDDAMNNEMTNSIDYKKNNTRILFIDDEVKFKVVKILQRAGWIHTQLIKDAHSLEQEEIKFAKIIFIDIQGVGIELTPKDEGLGLARAIKQKYPDKKIIIYSAEQTGDRFHRALREVDDSLSKDADPYQFQRIVEDFA